MVEAEERSGEQRGASPEGVDAARREPDFAPDAASHAAAAEEDGPARPRAGGFSATDGEPFRDDPRASENRRRPPEAPASLEEALGLGERGSEPGGGSVLERLTAALGRAVLGEGGFRGLRHRIWPGSDERGRQGWAGAWPLLIGVAVGAGLAAAPPVQRAVGDGFERLRVAMLARPEFAIRQLEVTGMRRLSEDALKRAVQAGGPERAALAFDYPGARERIEALGWVERASVTLKPPHTLAIEIVEREPAAVWRRGSTLKLLDPAGVAVASAGMRAAHPALPLLVGPGAEARVAEALRLHRVAKSGGFQVAAMTRVGGRRWDLELVGGPRIMLPEHEPQTALNRAVAWARYAGLLERGFEVVDLRLPFAPTARPEPRRAAGSGGAGGRRHRHGRL